MHQALGEALCAYESFVTSVESGTRIKRERNQKMETFRYKHVWVVEVADPPAMPFALSPHSTAM